MNVPRLELLGMSPMSAVNIIIDARYVIEENVSVEQKTLSFDAETLLSYIRDIFLFYGIYFDNSKVCFIVNSTSTNLKIARLVGKPLVVC